MSMFTFTCTFSAASPDKPGALCGRDIVDIFPNSQEESYFLQSVNIVGWVTGRITGPQKICSTYP